MSDTTEWASDGVARRLAQRMDVGGILLRRWGGCWIDFIAIAVLLVVSIALLRSLSEGIMMAVCGVLALAYFPVTEGIWGRSLGKLITGTIVVDADGRPPGIGRIVLRTLLRLVEVNPFLAGGIPAGICVMATKHKQRLGDLATSTYVVPVRDLEAASRRVDPVAAVFD
jgi:uncharacterized RDD family membrane protein YckC